MSEAIFVRSDVRAFLDQMAAAPPMPHTVEDTRIGFTMMYKACEIDLRRLAVDRTLNIPGPGGSLPARLFDRRETRAPGPLVVYFHGGGFFAGSTEIMAPFLADMAEALDLPVLSVDYRLCPEAKWPAAPDDAEAAARWAAASPAELGRKVTSLVICGDSAGGNLTIITSMALRDAPAAVPVLVQAPIYPVIDTQVDHSSHRTRGTQFNLKVEDMQWLNGLYGADLNHWRATPSRGSYNNLPPAVILTADLDPLRDHGRGYAADLLAAGTSHVCHQEAVGNIHGFIGLRRAMPSSSADVDNFFANLKTMIAVASADAMTKAVGRGARTA